MTSYRKRLWDLKLMNRIVTWESYQSQSSSLLSIQSSIHEQPRSSPIRQLWYRLSV
jgi:hypothetical protein